MLLQDANPHIRFAQRIIYRSNRGMVYASDVHAFYVLSGSASFRIGETEYPAQKDTFFLIPPGVPYQILPSDSLQMNILNFDFFPTRSEIRDFIPLAPVVPGVVPAVEIQPIDDCPVLNEPICLQEAGFLLQAFSEILNAMQTQEVYYRETASCCLKQMLISIAKASALASSKANRTAQKIIAYIKDHYSEELSIDQIAAQFSYNPYHINRIMRRATGTTVHKYLINYRITMAKQLLAESELSMEEIARSVGFADTSYFSNCFKKVAGCRPSEFRAMTTLV